MVRKQATIKTISSWFICNVLLSQINSFLKETVFYTLTRIWCEWKELNKTERCMLKNEEIHKQEKGLKHNSIELLLS
jgi:hypothetical protein